MHPTQLSHVKTSRRCTLAQRWVNVVFTTTFIPNQSGRHMMVQYWPNVMHPTQLSHSKTSHRCTLAKRRANVLVPTRYRSDCQWQNVNVEAMLGQRCTSNPNHRPTVLPYANVGPIYRISGIFRVGKIWRKYRLEGVLNFHWVLFSLFQGL